MDRELIEWVLALTVDDLPAPPFKIIHGFAASGYPAGLTVVNPAKYLGRLATEIAWGSDYIRWRTGALEAEVQRLKDWLDSLESEEEEYNPFK